MLYLINTRKLSAATCRQAIQSFRFFYKDVVGREVSRFELLSLKTPCKIPELLSHADVFAIVNACNNPKYRTMILVAYGTGIRLSEITQLRVSDILPIPIAERSCLLSAMPSLNVAQRMRKK